MYLLLCSAAIAQQPDTVVRDYFTGEVTNAVNVDRGFPNSDEVQTIYSIQSHRAGRVANVTDEAYIYQVIDAEPLSYSVFLNFTPSTGLLFPGAMLGDNCGLGNGYIPAFHEISSYSGKFFRSSADAQPGLADFHMELWDGDPFSSFDTTGFSNTPIAGTEADFVDIPAGTIFTTKALLPKGVTAPNSTVWMIISGAETGVNPSPCRLGWDIAYDHARIGNHAPSGDLVISQIDDTGFGVCCADGAACDVDRGVPCAGDIGTCADGSDGCHGFCQDDDAETPDAFIITGSRCDSHGGDGFCSNFTASINAPAVVSFSLVPVGGEGGEIIARGGDQIELEIYGGNWDPQGTGTLLRGWEADLDSSGYTSDFGGFVTPTLIPCTTGDDCIQAYGGICEITGEACSTDSDCPLFPIDRCGGSKCNFPGHPGYCEPGFIFTGRIDYILSTAGGDLPAVDLRTLDYRYASVDSNGAGIPPPSPFVPQYCGTLRLDVSADARGTFTVGFKPRPKSVMKDHHGNLIPLLGLIPARITVPVGRCCTNLTGAGECWDNVTEEQCQTMGTQPVVWDPDKSCAEPCCDCIDDSHCQDDSWCSGTEICNACLCESAEPPDCDDNLACTIDSCIEDGWGPVYPQGHCENLPDDAICDDAVWCNGQEVCDPLGGCQSARAPCDDGVTCTDDDCDESTQTCGLSTPNDAICDDAVWCNGLESCDPALGCQWASPPCGSAYCDEDRELCHSQPIPTVSAWGLVGLTLLLLITAKVYFSRREASHA